MVDLLAKNCAQDTGENFYTLDASADAVLSVLESDPGLQMIFGEVFALSPIKIVLTISQVTPHNSFLLELGSSAAYFACLKQVLAARSAAGSEEDDAATVDAPSSGESNGHKAGATVTARQ